MSLYIIAIHNNIWQVYVDLGTIVNFILWYYANLRELINFYSPEIIRRPKVFWWFQGEENLMNLLKFALVIF